MKGSYDLHKIAEMVQGRIETFPEIEEHVDFINGVLDYDVDMYTHKKMKTDPVISLEVLKAVLPLLQETEDYSNDALFELLKNFAAEHGWKNGQVMWPIRTALSGKMSTPGGATQLLELFGKEESEKRLEAAIKKLENA